MEIVVTILVPVYGVEKYIERCARSLFEQTYKNIEYIFVDDCSPDQSIAILERIMEDYPERKPYVRIIHHEKNRGLAAARNTSVESSTGDFILHVDSDDYMTPDAVEKLINRQLETRADIVTGQALRISERETIILERPQYFNDEDFIIDMIRPSIHHTIWGRLIRKSLYTDNNIQAKEGVNIGEDLQVMTQLSYYSKKNESVWDVIYYYDCTNENSYMNQYAPATSFRLKQDTASMEVVRDFLLNKNEKLCNEAERYLFSYYCQMMNLLGKEIDKYTFFDIKGRMMKICPQNRKMSRKGKIKFFNYNLYKLFKIFF